jgi:hypothetical protein
VDDGPVGTTMKRKATTRKNATKRRNVAMIDAVAAYTAAVVAPLRTCARRRGERWRERTNLESGGRSS